MSSPVVVLLKRRPKRLPTPDTCSETEPPWQRVLPSAFWNWTTSCTITCALASSQHNLPSRANASSQEHCLGPLAGCTSPSPKPRERIVSKALFGTTCWTPKSPFCSVLFIAKEKPATRRSTPGILYSHRSFRFSGL